MVSEGGRTLKRFPVTADGIVRGKRRRVEPGEVVMIAHAGPPLAECADAAADVPVISCAGELVAAGTQ
jgi:hypothetical protein